jgi:hypothetical protein
MPLGGDLSAAAPAMPRARVDAWCHGSRHSG